MDWGFEFSFIVHVEFSRAIAFEKKKWMQTTSNQELYMSIVQ